MCLSTLAGIVAEHGRIYRLVCNGKLKPREGAQYIYMLKETRLAVESIPPEPEVYRPPPINIISIPIGHCVIGNCVVPNDALEVQRIGGRLEAIEHHEHRSEEAHSLSRSDLKVINCAQDFEEPIAPTSIEDARQLIEANATAIRELLARSGLPDGDTG
jgi:hypothetical protein